MARSLLACCLLASIACGPSLKLAQRSVERYEQCYSTDYDAAVTPDRRHDCWRLARRMLEGPIPSHHVAAVDLRFDAAGSYLGFDADSPLTRSGGKREWIESRLPPLPRAILLVGDGTTDLEARPAVDLFAAFAGVVRRENVIARADTILGGPGLEQVLSLVFEGR